ncbi:MAG: hypothetical protein ACR2NB_12205 [Solirubrobacteraceae bacterium]
MRSSTSGDSARDYLGIDPSFPRRLPGSEVMNGHYETLMVLKADFAAALRGIEINRAECAWQQAHSWYVQRRLGSLTKEVGDRLRKLGGGDDWVGLSRLLAKRLRPDKARRRARMGRRARCRRSGRGCARCRRSTTFPPSSSGSRRVGCVRSVGHPASSRPLGRASPLAASVRARCTSA